MSRSTMVLFVAAAASSVILAGAASAQAAHDPIIGVWVLLAAAVNRTLLAG